MGHAFFKNLHEKNSLTKTLLNGCEYITYYVVDKKGKKKVITEKQYINEKACKMKNKNRSDFIPGVNQDAAKILILYFKTNFN